MAGQEFKYRKTGFYHVKSQQHTNDDASYDVRDVVEVRSITVETGSHRQHQETLTHDRHQDRGVEGLSHTVSVADSEHAAEASHRCQMAGK